MGVNRTLSISDICEQIWSFERKYNLIEFEVQGVFIWQLLRFKIFNELMKKNDLYGTPHTSADSLKEKLVTAPMLVWNSFMKSPLKGQYELDFLVYDHTRKVVSNNEKIDIYTYDFLEKQDQGSFEIIETPYLRKYYGDQKKDLRKSTDQQWFYTLIKKLTNPVKLSEKDKDKLKHLEKDFLLYFNIEDINIYEKAVHTIKTFKHQYNYNIKLFKKRKPACIYVVVSYNNMSVVAAAKDLGIKVLEIQHGVISDYHIAYNFGEPEKPVRYFPDKLLTFGAYWANTKGFPKQAEIEIYGFPYLNQQLKKYEGISFYNKRVLVLSQGTIGRRLSSLILKVAKENPDYHFEYKLHPGEYDRWKNEYRDLVEASKLANVEVIDHNRKSLYKLFAEAEFQIGVYSTAIFEGLTLNCKTILIDLPGIEYMSDLINQDLVKLAYNEEDIKNYLRNYGVQKLEKEYFFAGPSDEAKAQSYSREKS